MTSETSDDLILLGTLGALGFSAGYWKGIGLGVCFLGLVTTTIHLIGLWAVTAILAESARPGRINNSKVLQLGILCLTCLPFIFFGFALVKKFDWPMGAFLCGLLWVYCALMVRTLRG